jgi:transposase
MWWRCGHECLPVWLGRSAWVIEQPPKGTTGLLRPERGTIGKFDGRRDYPMSTHDTNDDANGGFRRVEILTGPGRRRRWSAEDKARIIAEMLVPGARVSAVARRWQLSSQQVFGWRRAARLALTTASTGGSVTTGFVPIVTEAGSVPTVPQAAGSSKSGSPAPWCASRRVWMTPLN